MRTGKKMKDISDGATKNYLRYGDTATDAEKLGNQPPKYYTDLIAKAQNTANAAVPKTGGGVVAGSLYPTTANKFELGITSLPWKHVTSVDFFAHGGHFVSRNPSNPTGDYIAMNFNSHQIQNAHATDAAKICSNGGVWIRNLPNVGWTAINASAFTQQSSVRFKDILGDMTRERARKVLDLELIKYRYKAEFDDNPKTHYGIKAEQADELELWDITEYSIHDGQPEAVDYSKLTPYLIGIAKDHDARVEQLEAKIAEQEGTIARLVKRIEKIEIKNKTE